MARFRNLEARGGSFEGRMINQVFGELGQIFEQYPDIGVTLDSIRYNLDGVDYTGSAPTMESIQYFSRAWGEQASSAQITGISSVPGGGYRFDLIVRW